MLKLLGLKGFAIVIGVGLLAVAAAFVIGHVSGSIATAEKYKLRQERELTEQLKERGQTNAEVDKMDFAAKCRALGGSVSDDGLCE